MKITQDGLAAQQPQTGRSSLTPLRCPAGYKWQTQKTAGRWVRCPRCWEISGGTVDCLILVQPAAAGSQR